ncbi:DUF3320 domain-containing protein [Georgenia thermotolerans]|uniref:DUF4011 domain-containing protein n=1 Tax=Georgenia thermotolerans TaxID=527326 RepID=A0A7J5UV48_9MICO|nr:DUF3320 domain-containing protein [Georgenia thermotolerans]KAE8766143.1 DUF4011 domain-containing protein [Georgenia thermotolerans]
MHSAPVPPGAYSMEDPRFLLRVLTEEWRVFREDFDRVQQALAQELRDVGNRWAHEPALPDEDAVRALDTMERLLRSVGATERAGLVRELRTGPEAATSSQDAAVEFDVPEASAAEAPVTNEREATGGEHFARRERAELRRGMARTVIAEAGLDVELVYRDAVNFALVNNGITPLLGLAIANPGAEPTGDIDISLSIAAPLPIEVASELHFVVPSIPAGGDVHLFAADLKWSLDPRAFVQLEEAVGAQLHLSVVAGGRRRHTESDVRLLARDEWWAVAIPESLAAFVLPRDRAVGRLLSEASDLLASRTGDPSLQGYQAGAERVLAIAEAVFDAMRAREIRYIDPPPSFEGTGQKIRRPGEVLDDRWGTCLDLATTYAAALEAAGLNPVITVCEGHAFGGLLVSEVHLPEVAVTDPNVIVTSADSGLLVSIETVALTAGKPGSFSDARATSGNWFRGGLDQVEYLLDVRAAHRRVRPLPVITSDGAVTVEVERAPGREIPVPRTVSAPKVAEPAVQAGKPAADEFPARIAKWRNALLDLSFRNPLLNLRTGRSGLELHVPSGSLPRLEDLIAEGRAITLLPHDQLEEIHAVAGARTAQDVDADQLAAILAEERTLFAAISKSGYLARARGLARKAKTIVEETGANNLFLTLGTLHWEDNGRQAQAPLFLVPVTLRGKRGRAFVMQLEEGGFAVPNQTLMEKLKLSKGFDVPAFRNPELDDSGIDLADALQQIRVALVQAGLPYRVEETAHLAILQFSTLQLWQDMGQHWQAYLKNPVVKHMVETPVESFVDPVPAPEPDPHAEATAYLPVPADGSQLEAIRAATAGRSFVLEGPPGTGKSQTITNLIANSLAHGKRVLFVAEKQAALAVVKRRLDAAGLGDFSLDLHGKEQSATGVREQLRAALTRQVASNPDSWEALRATYRSLVTNLARYPRGLHDVGPAGLSAWTARQVLLTLGRAEDADLAVPPHVVSGGTDIEAVYRAARDLGESAQDLGTSVARHPWTLAGPADPETLDRARIASALDALVAADASIMDARVRALVGRANSIDQLRAIGTWLGHAENGTAVAPDDAARLVNAHWEHQATTAEGALAEVRQAAAAMLAVFRPSVLGADLEGLLGQSRTADGKLFKGKPRRLILEQLAPHMVDGVAVAPKQLTPTLTQLLELRAHCQSVDALLAAVPGVTLPRGWNPLEVGADTRYGANLVALYDSAVLGRLLPEATAEARAAAPMDGGMSSGWSSHAVPASDVQPPFGGNGSQAPTGGSALPAGAGAAVATLAAAWSEWLGVLACTPKDVDSWRAGRSLTGALRESAPAWQTDANGRQFHHLARWSRVRCHLRDLAKAGLDEIAEAVRHGRIDPLDVGDTVRHAVARAALTERLSAAGLDGFDEAHRGRLITRYLETGEDVRKRMVAELPARIIAARSFRTDRLMGRVGELNRELGRRRGALSTRALLSKFGSVIGELTPCLLMSPHSVARFLEPGAIDVDIVVFDEASQIKVAEAVGAMGRGKSVVVVGDSKQMPPSTFGGGDGEEGDDDIPAGMVPVDQESILSEAVESNLERIWLSWHYRSQDESLIAFSNQYYYEDRLASFPGPPEERPELGVRWTRVDGTFERGRGRVNRGEAAAIVAEIEHRLVNDPDTSIGVVTFNVEQRDLILDLLEASDVPAVGAALEAQRDPIFVKNLENVQGDERDVILFSLAFSVDPVTGKLPLNFGPLNRVGGERRLNVAITRARQQVVLFSSFAPEDIELSRTNSLGLAHLRDYLTLAARGVGGASGIKRAPVQDLHRDEVATALRGAGLLVQEELGLSSFSIDLAVSAGAGRPWVAVLLDGPGWASRETVGDRDALPTTVLAGTMGWAAVERVWMPAWLARRDEVVTHLVQAAETAEHGAPNTAREHADGPADAAEGAPANGVPMPVDVPAAANGPMAIPAGPPPAALTTSAAPLQEDFALVASGAQEEATVSLAPVAVALDEPVFVGADDAPIHAGDRALLDHIDQRRGASRVREVVMDVIAVEAPVEAARLGRIVGRRFGLQRVTTKRSEAIVSLVPRQLVDRGPLGTFVWAEGTAPETYTIFRSTPDGVDRTLHEVAPQEIANAMSWVVGASHGATREETLRETAAVFGVGRLTTQIRERLERVLDGALAAGSLRETDGLIHG